MATAETKTKQPERVDATNFLREGIVKGRFLPNERLIEIEIARLIGTNRANVRTALACLEQEGLVVTEPNRGARVRLISDAEAIEIVQARSALELLVVRFAAMRATPEDRAELAALIGEMKSAYDSNDLMRYSATNGLFHKKLQKISRHETARKLLGTLRSQMVRFQYRAIFLPNRAAKSLAEHEAIMKAVEAGDPDRAERAMRRHLIGVIEGIEQVIASAQAEV
ncbi:GntR family transcriptional regulator [Afifella sp. IM 167]|uniref:GntR family transcriptional regulator n=1 Tax=Afifella sp. IM 167 TaxID=2033586 RepID=UPI001CC9AECE|nr:GntR family transcriptional regulator [Afifella sp. IM 167]MBZ8135401.1 GntR family transcriptional regulator [Afifella sp. IM 167]